MGCERDVLVESMLVLESMLVEPWGVVLALGGGAGGILLIHGAAGAPVRGPGLRITIGGLRVGNTQHARHRQGCNG